MAKEVDFSKFTSQQLAAARLMTDPEQRMTNAQIAEEVGISERQFYRWKEDKDFIELVNDLADRYMDTFMPETYRQLQRAIKLGSVKAIELALKRSGKLIERREVTSDVELQVTGVEGKTNEQLMEELKELERKAGIGAIE